MCYACLKHDRIILKTGLNRIIKGMSREESAFFSENLRNNHSTFPASATKINVDKWSKGDNPIFIFSNTVSKLNECVGQD